MQKRNSMVNEISLPWKIEISNRQVLYKEKKERKLEL